MIPTMVWGTGNIGRAAIRAGARGGVAAGGGGGRGAGCRARPRPGGGNGVSSVVVGRRRSRGAPPRVPEDLLLPPLRRGGLVRLPGGLGPAVGARPADDRAD